MLWPRLAVRPPNCSSTLLRSRRTGVPPAVTRVWKKCFAPHLYKSRNAIEGMFKRLKDFRRTAIRYDRLAINFHAARVHRRNRQLMVMSPSPNRADFLLRGHF
jgi:transposase